MEWTVDDITWEVDFRRAEIIRKSFDATGRSVSTLGVTDKFIDIEESFLLHEQLLKQILNLREAHELREED